MAAKEKVASLDALITYLTDNGIEESEVGPFLHKKLFHKKSLMDFIREDDWYNTWMFATLYVQGESW